RQGKSGGGFCTSFPTVGMPFVFANFNGTKGDAEVFSHEMGHAFQNYKSRGVPLFDYQWPTYESAEIHSMSLEFLTWPHMERFFGPDAERFRRVHLIEAILFLPYGTAVDHFQHEIYTRPDLSPAERHDLWRDMERTYLPWRDWGDLDYPARGGRWQLQRHVYLMPFYYIDYVLAQTCALQFWSRAESDFDGAMAAYVTLCERGGQAPFQELVRSAGLTSPFEAGCLAEVVGRARTALGAP
ncbi:MAG: M3 family metallopeptidase, partial [Acidimicrobiia bacterium]